MKKEKGITLISLAITVIVLMILTTIVTHSGIESLKEAEVTKFRTNLEIMQAQVNVLSEKYKKEIEEAEKKGETFTGVGKEIPSDLFEEIGGTEKFLGEVKLLDNRISIKSEDYRYFDEDVLKEIGVGYEGKEYLVDLKNRIVISTEPVKYEKRLCYTINQIKEGPKTGGLKREGNVTVENITYEKKGERYEITLENIQCTKYVGKYDVEYKEAKDSTWKIEKGLTGENYTFNVDKYGVYFIKIKDAGGMTTAREELVVSVYDGEKFEKDTKITMVKEITETGVAVEEVAIPAGFILSGVAEECAQTTLGVKESNEKNYTIDNGVVLYLIQDGKKVDWDSTSAVETAQKTYDQFVWVPVKNAIAIDKNEDERIDTTDIDLMIADGQYPMAIATDETNYRGVLYDFSEETDANGKKYVSVSDKSYSATSGYREPCAVTSFDNSTYLPQVNGILNTNYSNATGFGSALQTEFNTMVNKVNNNKGFWVGRYETSGMNNSTTTSYTSSNEIKVNIVKGTTTGIRNVTWYRMYAQQQIYSKKAGISATSSMIWGSQWDQIIIWMKEVKNERVTTNGEYYVTNSVGYGNYGNISGAEVYDKETLTSGPATTGASDYFKVKNIYDLAGNIREWSLEGYSRYNRVICGGGYYRDTDDFRIRVVYDGADGTSLSNEVYGSRTSLY